MDAHVVLTYPDNAPAGLIAEFESEMRTKGIALAMQARPAGILYASLDWLAPTAFAVFLAKPYFESFLGEAGKDHYRWLKKSCAKLGKKLARLRTTAIGKRGKLDKERRYSPTFSLASRTDEVRIKALIPEDLSDDDAAEVMEALIDFMRDYHLGNLDHRTQADLQEANILGGTLLVSYETKTRRIVFPNPMEKDK